MTKKQFGKERVCESITEGSQGKSSRQEPGCRNGNRVEMNTPHGLFRLLVIYTSQDDLAEKVPVGKGPRDHLIQAVPQLTHSLSR